MADLVFKSDFEPAKPSQVIMQMLAQFVEDRQLVWTEGLGFSANNVVFNEIDDFVQRYCDNGGSTIEPKKEDV